MKQIPVGRNHFALVDDEDYDDLIQFKWKINKSPTNKTNYAIRRWVVDKKWHHELMHKRITGFMQTDHINCDGLDNRKSNLREANHSQNTANESKRNGLYTSRYKGVSWHKSSGKWRARITFNGKEKCLGLYVKEIDAARSYDIAAFDLFGTFARPNLDVWGSPEPGIEQSSGY